MFSEFYFYFLIVATSSYVHGVHTKELGQIQAVSLPAMYRPPVV